MSLSQVSEPRIRCPSCRFGYLVHQELHKWECTSCSYWTVNPPTRSRQSERSESAGSFTPLSHEQTDALQRGREAWGNLIGMGKKALFGFLITYSILSFSLNLAVRTALDQSLSLSWTISAWVISGFLGIVSILLFASSSGRRKVAFAIILSFFIYTGAIWFNIARAIASI